MVGRGNCSFSNLRGLALPMQDGAGDVEEVFPGHGDRVPGPSRGRAHHRRHQVGAGKTPLLTGASPTSKLLWQTGPATDGACKLLSA